MSDGSKIEWTDATWNPVLGCDKVSPGCDHCYAIRTAHRMQANPNPKVAAAYAGTEQGMEWTGRVNLLEDRLALPLRWTKPRRIFVNAQSDLFHADVPDDFIARVWAVMATAYRHTFQILTKRHGRMRSLLSSPAFWELFDREWCGLPNWAPRWPDHEQIPVDHTYHLKDGPLSNVWLGVSVEDQQRADLRVPALIGTPAAVRFLSCEPLLGPVDLSHWLFHTPECDAAEAPWCICHRHREGDPYFYVARIDWVIAGGESGPDARPMHPDWARQLRDQCTGAGVPFLFKQWGGARASSGGRELDGRTWDEYPESGS